MKWTFISDPAEFPAAAEEWLLRDPVANTIPLTALARSRRGLYRDQPIFGWLAATDAPDGRDVRGVVLHTPPHPVLLCDVPPESIPPLAEALRSREVAGAFGPVGQVDAFAEEWGATPVRRLDERLYRLGTLVEPSVQGHARRARPNDLDRMVDWYVDFVAEAGAPGRETNAGDLLRLRIAQNELVVWENEGEIVAMAGFSTPIAGMSRVGPVYTLPRHRRRGYGSAVTHAATVAAREAGAAEVVLFTDLANPTSNGIYQALGYRPVSDYATIFYT